MLKNKKIFALIIFIIILFLLFIILYKVKKSVPKKISKNGAIILCKYIVYNKIDPTLSNKFKEFVYEQNDNSIDIVLIFFAESAKNINNPLYTRAYCTFDRYYSDNKNILLKKFFYKDIKNNIYLYYDTNINIF